MLWKGKALLYREDFTTALESLENESDAKEFKAIFKNAYPHGTGMILGFLVGDVAQMLEARLLKWLHVKDPFLGMTPGQIFMTGYDLRAVAPHLANFLDHVHFRPSK